MQTVVAGVRDTVLALQGKFTRSGDEPFASRLALLEPSEWDPATARAAWEMLGHYLPALDAVGVRYDELPVPPPLPDFKVRFARRDVEIRTRTREAASRRTIVLHGPGYLIRADYEPGMGEAIKAIPGRVRDPIADTNWIPIEQTARLRDVCARWPFVLEEPVRQAFEVWGDLVPPGPEIVVQFVAGALHLAFPFNRELNASAKTLPAVRFTRNPTPGWQVPANHLDEVAAWLEDKTWRADLLAQQAFEQARLEREMRLASAAPDAELPDEVLSLFARQPYPFQRAGIAYAMRARRTFIADEMGLGKSGQALCTLEALDAFPALLVAPASLTRNLAREASAWIPGRTTQLIQGVSQQLLYADIILCPYDVLYAHVPILTRHRLGALVLDESHYAKNPRARRSTAALEIADALGPDAVRLLLTGTPFEKQRSEIKTQLRILDRYDELGGDEAFRELTSAEYNARMRSICYVRRLKKDVLKDLPEKRWLPPIEVDPDPAALAEYRRAERDIISYVAQRAREIAIRLAEETGEPCDPDAEAVAAALKAEAAQHLVAIQHLKRLAAKAKMPAVRAWVRQFTDAGQKLVLFGTHLEVVNDLADEFDAPKITGEVTGDDRQKAVDRFQQDDSTMVIACSIRAAGVGLTLTAASDVAFVEFGWNPSEMDQAIDRCHRIGQRESVSGWRFIIPDSIDQWVLDLIDAKRVEVDALTEGGIVPEGAARVSVAGDLLVRLRDVGLAGSVIG